ncbi:MAG: helix-turn-helix transcriptional regulator [Paludibacteraceae bacterium]|nr:helix-turn-helix transcriptional regulator [Paludibacteraceae bacterium]
MVKKGEIVRFGTKMGELWREYKSEVVFFAVIVVIMVLGHRLSHFLPVEFFENVLAPFQATAIMTVCLSGAWLLFRHTEGSRVRLAWAWTLLVWGVTEALLVALSAIWHLPTLHSGTDPLSSVSIVAGNILGWALILYPTEALRPGWMNFRRALTQVLPLIALLVVDYFIPWNLASLLTLYPVVLVVLLLAHVRAYRKWCEENYSSLDDIDAQWIVRYLAMLAAVGLSFFYLCVSHNPNRLFMQNILLFVMFVYSTEKILLRKDPWEGMVVNEEGELPIEEEPETVDTLANAAYRAKLEQWMQEKKPYLNPNFRLIDMREVLPLNRTYLSQLIHSEYDSTFYQFVNGYRIEEAKRLLHENPDMRIEDVASGSGFSSREVFTRVFTKETGVTPREWSKKV